MDQTVSGRTYSWRQLLQSNGIVNSDNVNGVDTLKQLLDDKLFDVGNVYESLQKIIKVRKTSITDWRYPIIDDIRLLDYPAKEYMFIWLNTDDSVMIPKRRNGNSNRIEVWSYYYFGELEKKYADENVECPFQYFYKGNPCICLYFKDSNTLLNENINEDTYNSIPQSSNQEYEGALKFFTTNGSDWFAQISKKNTETGQWVDLNVENDGKLISKVLGDDTYPILYKGKGDDAVSWILSFKDRLNVGNE